MGNLMEMRLENVWLEVSRLIKKDYGFYTIESTKIRLNWKISKFLLSFQI